MKSAFERLKRMVGKVVRSVAVHVIFFGVEQRGEVDNVSITFADGARFEFGCAGDGGIFVISPRKSIGDAPNITTMYRTISELSGQLKEVVREKNRIHVRIDETTIVLTNDDDQIDVALNGEQLPKEFYSRA